MPLVAPHPPLEIPPGAAVGAVEGRRGSRRVGCGSVILSDAGVHCLGGACQASSLPEARFEGLRRMGERASALGLDRMRVLVDDPRYAGLDDEGGGAGDDRSCHAVRDWIASMAARGLRVCLIGMPGRTETDDLAARLLELAWNLARAHEGTFDEGAGDGWLERIVEAHPRLAPGHSPEMRGLTLARSRAAWWFGVPPATVDDLYRKGHVDIDPDTGGVRRAGAIRVFREVQRLRWPERFGRWD